jgi:hypothetical protein
MPWQQEEELLLDRVWELSAGQGFSEKDGEHLGHRLPLEYRKALYVGPHLVVKLSKSHFTHSLPYYQLQRIA